jgi:hypothetical protein
MKTTKTKVEKLISRWDSGDGKPYKGSLIDWDAYKRDPANPGCMCAQGQALHGLGGWSFEDLRERDQKEADKETAKLLGISTAHSVLLRNINDNQDGAPSIVLTDPGRVLGGEWSRLLDFWSYMDTMSAGDWTKMNAAGVAAGDAAWDAARDAARVAAWAAAGAEAGVAARNAAWAAAGNTAWAAAGVAAGDAAGDAAWNAAWAAAGGAALEIQGQSTRKEFFFLPMFGFASPQDVPKRPKNYGQGIVPKK